LIINDIALIDVTLSAIGGAIYGMYAFARGELGKWGWNCNTAAREAFKKISIDFFIDQLENYWIFSARTMYLNIFND